MSDEIQVEVTEGDGVEATEAVEGTEAEADATEAAEEASDPDQAAV
jgi:hypothetical protein